MKKNQKTRGATEFDLSKVEPKKLEEARLFQELFDSGVKDIKSCAEKLGMRNEYLYRNLDLFAYINGKENKHVAYGIRKFDRKPSKTKCKSGNKPNNKNPETVTTEKMIFKKAEETIVNAEKENIPEKLISTEELLESVIESANKVVDIIEGTILEFDKKVGQLSEGGNHI